MGTSKKKVKSTVPFFNVIGQGCGILVAFVLLLGTVNFIALNITTNTYTGIIENEGKILELANEIKVDMLQARRAEKDVIFLAQVAKIATVNELISNISAKTIIIKDLSTSDLVINAINDIQTSILSYWSLFNSVAQSLINRGGGWFGPMNGTVGATWTSINAAESLITRLHNDNSINDTVFFQIESLTYQMRTNSSMIMMTRRTVGIDQAIWISAVPIIIQEIITINLTTHLNNYQLAFDKMVIVDNAVKIETVLFDEAIQIVEMNIDTLSLEVNFVVTADYQRAAEEVFSLQLVMIVVLVIVAIIAIGLTYYLSRSLSIPVMDLEKQVFQIIRDVNEISAGDFNKRIEIDTKNELKLLEPSMNSMVSTLVENIRRRQHSEEQLRQTNSNLDLLVFERTVELHQAQKQLLRDTKLKAIGGIAGSIAHDLRNPLGAINNSVYFLKLKLQDPEEKINKHLSILQREVDRASQILTDMLDFARTSPPNFIKSDFNQLIKLTLSELTVPGNISIIINLDSKLNIFFFDPDKLRLVLQNLIINAFQAMLEGGTLNIESKWVKNKVQFLIHDTGIGIREEDKLKIFEPLYTTKAKGIGFGLYIVKNQIELHKGNVNVESTEGTGTTFSFTIPYKLD